MNMPEEDNIEEIEELDGSSSNSKINSNGNVINFPTNKSSELKSSSVKGMPSGGNKNNVIDLPSKPNETNNTPSPGEKTGPGKVMGKNGKEEKSAGREIVDGGVNAAKIGAAVASGGGSAAAEGGAAAAKGGSDAAKRISDASKKGNKQSGTPTDSNNVKDKAKNKSGGLIDRAKNAIADKIDKESEKSPVKKAAAEELADQAKVLNRGMDAISKAKSGDIKGAADSAKDAVKQYINNKLKKVKRIAIIIFLGLVALAGLIMIVWSYIDAALAKLDEGATNVANAHEKVDNFLNGLGFQNSEEAFYDELNKLNKKHDYQINIPILMSTLFYDETHSNGDVGFETGGDDGENSVIGLALARRWVKSKVKESNETIGEDGLTYSSNKIYRLRKLVRNQFGNPVLGQGTNKTEHAVGVLEYLDLIKDNIDSELYEYIKNLFLNVVSLANPSNTAESLYQWLIEGDETFFTTDTGAHIEALKDSLIDLLDAIFSPFFDISGISLYDGKTCTHVVCVNYYTYGYDEDVYINYLKKYYVRYMPEFKKYINASTDEIKDQEIDKVIAEIKENAENYEDVFGKQNKTSEFYSVICVGNIKKELVNELEKPVDVKNSSPSFTGSYNYGVTGGSKHNGLDINSTTTGNTTGDSVYSIFANGEVLESTADNTYSDKKVKGGWVKVKYTASLSEGTYKFSVVYGGLSKSSLKAKKGDKLKLKEVIGTIGSKDESDADIASLHFGFYDEEKKTFLDPSNIFIPCVNYGGTYSMPNYPNAEKVVNAIVSDSSLDDRYKDITHLSAILANLNLESVGDAIADMNPEAVEGGYNEYTGGIGISQWTNSGRGSTGRNSNLKAYASKQGSTWKDLDVQVKFLMAEYTPGGGADGYAAFEWLYNSWMESFLNQTSAEDAAEEYATHFERCGTCHMDKRRKLVASWKSVLESSKVEVSADAGPNGGSSGSGSSKVEKYLAKMTEMANDSSIGYSQASRYLNPNVDCASFIYYGLVNSGVIQEESWVFDCEAMGGVLKKNGFKEYSYDSSILKRGDIVVDPQHHATTYYGDGKQIAAHSNYSGGDGDPDDNEVNISTYSDSYHNYQYIYRLE